MFEFALCNLLEFNFLVDRTKILMTDFLLDRNMSRMENFLLRRVLRLISIRRRLQAWRETFFVSLFSFMRGALTREAKYFAPRLQSTPNGNEP